MKRKRLAAKVFAVIMAISASLPMNSNTLVAYAAENADAVSAEEAESGGTQEEVASEVEEEIFAEEEESTADTQDITTGETAEIVEKPAEEVAEDSVDVEEAYKEDEDEPQSSEEEESATAAEEFIDEEGYIKQNSTVDSTNTEDQDSEAEGYTVTYDANGNHFSYIWDDEQEEYVQKTATSMSMTKQAGDDIVEIYGMESTEGNMLIGWSKEANGEEMQNYADFVMPDHDITLYAIWADAYEITLDANGGYFWGGFNWCTGKDIDGEKTLKVLVEKGDDVQLDIPYVDEEGMSFVGWSYEKDGELIDESRYEYSNWGEDCPFFMPEKDCTLYAVWGKKSTITFDANGGVFDYIEGEDDQDVGSFVFSGYAGAAFDYKTLEGEIRGRDDSSRLVGWSRERDGEVIESPYLCFEDEDYTVYAVWEEDTSDDPDDPEKKGYNVTFNANGGYFVSSWDDYEEKWVETETFSMKVSEGDEIYTTIPENDSGLDFVGWSFKKDGEIAVYGSDEFTPLGDCTLYAIWDNGDSTNKDDEYLVTFDANGGYFDSVYDTEKDDYVYNVETFVKRISSEEPDYLDKPSTDDPYQKFLGWSTVRNGDVEIFEKS